MARSWGVYAGTFVVTLALVWVAMTQLQDAVDEGTLEKLGLADGLSPGAVVFVVVMWALVLGGVHFVAMFAATPSWRRRALYVTRLPWSGAGAAVFIGAIMVGAVIVAGALSAFVDVEESMTVDYLLGPWVTLVALGCFAIVLRERGANPWRALGFARHRFWRHVAMGAAACLAFRFALLPVLDQIVTALLNVLGQTVEGHEAFTDYDEAGSLWERLVILGAITVAAPLLEEIVFRGVLFQTIKRYAGSTVAIVASAGLFGAVHGTLYVGLNIFFLGLLFGYLFDKTGSIVPCITLHFLFNVVPAAGLLLGL